MASTSAKLLAGTTVPDTDAFFEAQGDPGVAGTTLRVVAPQSSTASCQTDEIMISAYCTGTFTNYPLVPLTNGARCGANPNSTTLRVTIVCAKR